MNLKRAIHVQPTNARLFDETQACDGNGTRELSLPDESLGGCVFVMGKYQAWLLQERIPRFEENNEGKIVKYNTRNITATTAAMYEDALRHKYCLQIHIVRGTQVQDILRLCTDITVV